MRFRISNTRLVEDPLSFRLLTKRSNPNNGVARRAGTKAQVIRLAWISQPNLRLLYNPGTTVLMTIPSWLTECPLPDFLEETIFAGRRRSRAASRASIASTPLAFASAIKTATTPTMPRGYLGASETARG